MTNRQLQEELDLLRVQSKQREHVRGAGRPLLQEQILRQRNLLGFPPRHWMLQWFGEQLDDDRARRRASDRSRSRNRDRSSASGHVEL